MRWVWVLVVLAGCGDIYRPPAEAIADYDRQMGGPPPAPPPVSPEVAARNAQAEAICAARAEMAGATYAGRGFGMSGAVLAGMEAGIAAERVRHACLDAYHATGQVPGF